VSACIGRVMSLGSARQPTLARFSREHCWMQMGRSGHGAGHNAIAAHLDMHLQAPFTPLWRWSLRRSTTRFMPTPQTTCQPIQPRQRPVMAPSGECSPPVHPSSQPSILDVPNHTLSRCLPAAEIAMP
jgi:hypothetical protein